MGVVLRDNSNNFYKDMTVEEMSDKFGFDCEHLGFNMWKVTEKGKVDEWKIIEEKSREFDKGTNTVTIFYYKLLHKGFNQYGRGTDYDGYHFQRNFIDLNYLGNYIKNHISIVN